jgi:hypothetical protein
LAVFFHEVFWAIFFSFFFCPAYQVWSFRY